MFDDIIKISAELLSATISRGFWLETYPSRLLEPGLDRVKQILFVNFLMCCIFKVMDLRLMMKKRKLKKMSQWWRKCRLATQTWKKLDLPK
jgi:hypothetical protein